MPPSVPAPGRNCPSCKRRVPFRVDTCRCGYSLAEDPDLAPAEASTDGSGLKRALALGLGCGLAVGIVAILMKGNAERGRTDSPAPAFAAEPRARPPMREDPGPPSAPAPEDAEPEAGRIEVTTTSPGDQEGSLRRGVRTAFGVQVEDEPGGHAGVYYVYQGGPAAQAGISVGDVIEKIDGKPVVGHAGFTSLARRLEPEVRIEVVISRHGSSQTLLLEPRESADVFSQACDLGDAEGCTSFGTMLERGEGVASDLPRARTVLRRGCDGGSYSACINLGNLLRRGRGGEVDGEAAARLYIGACDAGVPTGCFNAGVVYQGGDGVTRDLATAHRYFDAACRLGDFEGCRNAAKLAGQR